MILNYFNNLHIEDFPKTNSTPTNVISEPLSESINRVVFDYLKTGLDFGYWCGANGGTLDDLYVVRQIVKTNNCAAASEWLWIRLRSIAQTNKSFLIGVTDSEWESLTNHYPENVAKVWNATNRENDNVVLWRANVRIFRTQGGPPSK